MTTSRIPRWTAAGSLLALAALPSSLAAPAVHLVEEDRVVVSVIPLAVAGEPDRAVELRVPDEGVETRLELEWPEAGSTTQVVFSAKPRPPRPGAKSVLEIEARTLLPDGRRTRARRELVFNDSFTALFEVCREGDRSLTLAVQAEHTRETVLSTRVEIGAPIRLQLEIQRIEEGRSVLLETNQLNTFVGQSVAYSFRLGETGASESLRIQLSPQRLYGDLARIEIEVSGMLPDGDSLSVISRREEWMTTRGATSSMSVELGDPPTGFRFLVTPQF